MEIEIKTALPQQVAYAQANEKERQALIDELGLKGQDIPYKEVSTLDARMAMCRPFRTKWPNGGCSCETMGRFDHNCFLLRLVREPAETTTTKLSYGVLLKLKEAQSLGRFERFEIWRPESELEQRLRKLNAVSVLDPWLVGIFNNKNYLVFAWE